MTLRGIPFQLRQRQCGSRTILRGVLCLTVMSAPLLAQSFGGSPWENAVDVLMQAFTGPIARGLSLVSIVIGGLMFAFGEGGSKRMFSGILFGIGMAVSAVSFFNWLFK